MDSARSPRFYTGPAHWKVTPARDGLEAEDFTVVEWSQLRKRWVIPARKMGIPIRLGGCGGASPEEGRRQQHHAH